MRTFKYITIWTILIGVMGFAINSMWPNSISFLQPRTTHPMADFNVEIQTFNFNSWLQNIQIAAQRQTNLTLDMPTKQWQSGAFELITLTAQILNNLGVILNYMILAINILIFPFRIIAYIIQLIIAFVGLNINAGDNNAFYWLFNLTDWFITRIQIPYIP